MKTILVVDDDPDFLRVLSSALSSYFQVSTATGVRDAIGKIETDPTDCVCSDFNMPDGTGIDLLRHLRQQAAVPFILMSVNLDYTNIRLAEHYGAVFISKMDKDFVNRVKKISGCS